MEFRILGPLEVCDQGRPLPLGGAKRRALLALLLLHGNEVVSTDRLVDELWGEEPPATATKVIQVYVSQLRKALEPRGSGRVLVTRPPGYLLHVEADALDVHRFERLAGEARAALAHGSPAAAAAKLREALGLWRGSPLADFTYEPFAQTAIARLEELRLVGLEDRIEADLALGRHGELAGELEALVARHPLRERLRGQLMLALYRSGRQAEALEAYQATRRTLVEELGIEPGPALQELEKAILRQDTSLGLVGELPFAATVGEPAPVPAPERSILVVPQGEESLPALLALAEPLATSEPPRELIMARLIPPPAAASGGDGELARVTAELRGHRAALIGRRVAARVAAFTSAQPGADIVRLASEQPVDLLFLDTRCSLLGDDGLGGETGVVLASAPCDVVLAPGWARGPAVGPAGAVLVPFGGTEHDWAALELGAWIARAHGASVRLLGTAPDLGKRGRDASRLLADASLIIQRLAGVVPEPVLVAPGPQGVTSVASDAGLLVVGLSERWRQDGLGPARLAIANTAPAPVVFVRRGMRPGGLAPREDLTRFRWSVARAGRET